MRRGDSRAYWSEVVRRQAESGLSAREFCSEAGLSVWSFYSWRSRIERDGDGRPDTRSFARVKVRDAGETAVDSCGIMVVVGHSRCVRVEKDFDEETLVRVVRVLDQC